MSDKNKSYELLKPGLSYITERTSALGYSDVHGKMQYLQPVSRYKAFTEIKRGEAVSVVTKQDLENKFIEANQILLNESFTWNFDNKNDTSTKSSTETTEEIHPGVTPQVSKRITTITKTITFGSDTKTFIKQTTELFSNHYLENNPSPIIHVLTSSVTKIYEDTVASDREWNGHFEKEIINGAYNDLTNYIGERDETEDWTSDKIYIHYEYSYDPEADNGNGGFIRKFRTYNRSKVDEVLVDPDPYVMPTNTKVHERAIGLAMEYAEKYGDILHIQPYGKFIYDPEYEAINNEYYEGSDHEQFNHTGKEYNPGFTYADVGKKVYIKFPMDGDTGGHLTVDEEETSKHYHNIICLGYLTDAPQEAGKGKTEIEISISGDQRGLLEATQFEATLGENVIISSHDPIRVFAIGKEDDTKFKARLCFTPQGKSFNNTDFIAFQKMDGNTVILHFTEDFNLEGVVEYEDIDFLHMAKCYARIKTNGVVNTMRLYGIDDIQSVESVRNNINIFKDNLETAFRHVTEISPLPERTLNIETFVSSNALNPYGYIDLESTEFGGYYVMYVSRGLRSKFDGSITLCHGSHENHGKAVIADVRIPERRDLIGIYYGASWDTELPKGYSTIFMRMGEFDIPEQSSQVDGNFVAGQEYFLGTNGRVVKHHFNQFDFISKIGSIKYGVNGDLRFVVSIGQALRHYNGDLPVGYMKPSIRAGTSYVAEYGFLLMDGTTTYPKEHPYDVLHTRLLGWFDPADVDIEGSDRFKIPAVSKTKAVDIEEPDGNGGTVIVQKHIRVPMQIKFLPSGIYEEMPYIPFKRFIGRFKSDWGEPIGTDMTPVKCALEDCDISDIVDYGITEEGYTKPGLDNLDIRLFVDPNENYESGPHDWHEVHEGFINWNNSTTFGYTWEIVEEDPTLEHPYGCYKLRMSLGSSQGVAYVTSENQAPKKLNNCYYKVYVARREVFTRQFDIEKIYKDYLTNSIFTDEMKTKLVVDKAVTGKAVLDAIENRHWVDTLIARKDAVIKIGEPNEPVSELMLNTDGMLPIIANDGVEIKNSEDSSIWIEFKNNVLKYHYPDNVIPKGILSIETDNGETKYSVDGNTIPTASQVRSHAENTIDNKNFLQNYADKDTKHGLIHGMIFGKDGNIDASTVWGLSLKTLHNNNDWNLNSSNAYIPVTYKTSIDNEYNFNLTDISLVRDNLFTEKVSKDTVNNAVLDVLNVNSTLNKFYKVYQVNGEVKAREIFDFENKTVSFLSDDNTPLSIVAGEISAGSRSSYKRIHGEQIRDRNLVSDENMSPDSLKYSDNVEIVSVPVEDSVYPDITEYKFEKSTNKFKNLLGSALQAAYEMPLAYWQYNTEREWYKDRIGIIIERVQDVANNIKGKKYASAIVGSLIITSKKYGDNDVIVTFLKEGITDEVKVTVTKNSIINTYTATTIGELIEAAANDPLVVFSGVATEKLLFANDDFMNHLPFVVQLSEGTNTGTERKIFDNLFDVNPDNSTTTTPSVKAQIICDGLKVVAKNPGYAGNSISVKCEKTGDTDHYRITVYNGDYEKSYIGTSISELHEIWDGDELIPANDDYVDFQKAGESDELSEFERVFLKGGSDGDSVSQNLINTDYKENEYQYTDDEAKSIKEYMNAIIDNSSTGQDIISTVGLLLNAAKETQERLLRVEASTFGRDYATIPGNHEPYKLSGMTGVVPDPTNYGLNRLIRAICQELYYDSNPFDSALANGGEINTNSFSRIDRIDREIHGELNTEDSLQTAPNILDRIDSSTYPYEDMVRSKEDTAVRENEVHTEETDEVARNFGTGIETRVDMSLYNRDITDNYTGELEGNTVAEDKKYKFNGIVDAIYRITTKLNALTESINNSDNIADAPKRLNTIRQNIEHIIREAYFDDCDEFIATGNVEAEQSWGTMGKPEIFENVEHVSAEPYQDVNGPENARYEKTLSRFDKLTDDLYNFTITVEKEGIAAFQNFYEMSDEMNGDKQVYYTGRKFNGKHLLVDNKTTDDTQFTAESHVPQNLNDYNYATLLDIVVDAIGTEFFRKNVSEKPNKDENWNNRTELRHNRTISERLDKIEECLDKVVGKLSRKHSFENETSILDNSVPGNVPDRTKYTTDSNNTVFSIERYLQFLNDYLGYYQTTSNDIEYGKDGTYNPSTTQGEYSNEYTEHWENGYDYKEFRPTDLEEGDSPISSGLDGESTKEFSAEWSIIHRRNIHAGLVNMLSRIQNSETRDSRYDAILGEEFNSKVNSLKTTYVDFGSSGNDSENSLQKRESSSTYTLTDDIRDVLKTIYGTDNHNKNEPHNLGSFTDYTHRTLVSGDGSNKSTRFVTDGTDNSKNIIDIMIHDMYLLPQPLRKYNSNYLHDTWTGNDAWTENDYFKNTDVLAPNALPNNSTIYVPTSNEKLMDEIAHSTLDSRLATYYDFDCGKNVYDIPDRENALSWNNRDEFFNETGRFHDLEVITNTDGHFLNNAGYPMHPRLSRFEVIENEIRSLRKLIGLDFKKWNGDDDLAKLKFEGELKFYGDRTDNGFSGNPFGIDLGSDGIINSFTDQFNSGVDGEQIGKPTNILKFLLNADKSERLLRTEIGFSDPAWSHERFPDSAETNNSGYDWWYDNTYSSSETDGTLVSALLNETINSSNTLQKYGLRNNLKPATNAEYQKRHTVYDRILALEKNAVQVDAWLDSIKNIYHTGCGKNTGTGNIFDIINYLGNYTWDDSSKNYYGRFGVFNEENLRLSEKTVESRYDTVTNELTGHHDALKELFDIIGVDAHKDSDIYVFGEGATDKERTVEKRNTLWARLNAVELLNQHDVDLTNIITVNFTDADVDKVTNGIINLTNGKDFYYTSLTGMLKVLSPETESLATSLENHAIGSCELIASKGYVDNAIIAAINNYAKETDIGDEKFAAKIQINGTDILDGENAVSYNDEKTDAPNEISTSDYVKPGTDNLTDNVIETLDEQDYYNAQTIEKLVTAINHVNDKNRKSLNNVYKNVDAIMTALQYTYDDRNLVQTTTGSLLGF